MGHTTNYYRKGSFGAHFRSQLSAQTRHQNAIPETTPRQQQVIEKIRQHGLNPRGNSRCTALVLYQPPCTALAIYEPPLEFKPVAPPLVDWSRPMSLPRPSNPNRRETFYPVYCPSCNSTRMLRAFDARRVESGTRRVCARCQSIAAGSKGYAATCETHGKKWAVERLRDYLLDHPRPTMQAVIDILDNLGVDYECEYWLETETGNVYLIDAVLPGKKAIEADGTYVHSLDKQRAVDERKRAYLRRRGYELLVITDQDVAAGRAESMIEAYAEVRAGLCEDASVSYVQVAIPF